MNFIQILLSQKRKPSENKNRSFDKNKHVSFDLVEDKICNLCAVNLKQMICTCI